MNAHTLRGCVRLRRKTAGTVIDMTVKCEGEGGEDCLRATRTERRRRGIQMCQALFLVCCWSRTHFVRCDAGKWKQSNILRRCRRSSCARLQPQIRTMMYYFHIKTAQLYCHLEATFPFLFTGKAHLAPERGYRRFAAAAICLSTTGK